MTEEKVDETQVTPEDEGANDAKPVKPFLAFDSEQEHDDYMDRMLKERLERKDKKLAEQRAETERKAREQALKDQEDWKKLAEERTETIEAKNTRISELETVEGERDSHKERVENLEKRLAGLIKPQLEAVPELFRPFVEEKTVEEQAEWLEKNAEKLTEAVGGANGAGSRPAGSRPTGRASTPQRAEADKEAREGQRRARVSAI